MVSPEFHQSESHQINDWCGVSHQAAGHHKERQDKRIVLLFSNRLCQTDGICREDIPIKNGIADDHADGIGDEEVDQSCSDYDNTIACHPVSELELILGCQAQKPEIDGNKLLVQLVQ